MAQEKQLELPGILEPERNSPSDLGVPQNRFDVLNRLLTMRAAAEALGIPDFKLQRAAKAGLIPTYKLLNARRYVRLRDILERMSASSSTPSEPTSGVDHS